MTIDTSQQPLERQHEPVIFMQRGQESGPGEATQNGLILATSTSLNDSTLEGSLTVDPATTAEGVANSIGVE